MNVGADGVRLRLLLEVWVLLLLLLLLLLLVLLFVLYVFDYLVNVGDCVDIIVDNLVESLTDRSGRLDITDRIEELLSREKKSRESTVA